MGHARLPYTKLGYEQGIDIQIVCIDIQRKPRIDLSKTKERDKLLQAIRAGAYDAILPSPPCSTFSRAPWANFKGPRPVRSYENPRGFDTLTGAERRKCILGNIFADFSWEVLELAAQLDIAFTLLEQPEDLGAMSCGPRAGRRPASMWQWPQRDKILGYSGFKTFAFHQGNLGAGYPKPTWLLAKIKLALPSFCHGGVPTFDAKGYYTGPLYLWLKGWVP